ncbi:unnamed protein product [Caenorhabditis angaria]|uniref:Uncharacterized protein n=1 Tax=Caenorhabditis angaria TaxID=860376 RepID=A0A9P1I5K3_9PELO|nr:unnamed protein product [Caenorhabditis angaria]
MNFQLFFLLAAIFAFSMVQSQIVPNLRAGGSERIRTEIQWTKSSAGVPKQRISESRRRDLSGGLPELFFCQKVKNGLQNLEDQWRTLSAGVPK